MHKTERGFQKVAKWSEFSYDQEVSDNNANFYNNVEAFGWVLSEWHVEDWVQGTCISYFPIAVIKLYDQRNLYKVGFIWA